MNQNSKIYIAGHTGMVGSAIHRNLLSKGFSNFVVKTIEELDLTNQQLVLEFFKKEKPEYVFLAAAKVGGIVANNKFRAQFIYENLQIQNNIIHSSFLNGVKKLLFLGSSCIYPKYCQQPMKEEHLLTGELEYTNEPYALAKIAGLRMCESYNLQYGTNYISIMPTNLYGPNDNYNLETSHVLPALIRKMHLGKCLKENNWDSIYKDLNTRPIEGVSGKNEKSEIVAVLNKYGIKTEENGETFVTLWGSGSPRREFLHADDLADASVYVMQNVNFSDLVQPNKSGSASDVRNIHINVGYGSDISIKELAQKVKEVVGFEGIIKWDIEKPDGTSVKLLDSSKLRDLGWKSSISFEDGVKNVYSKYIE